MAGIQLFKPLAEQIEELDRLVEGQRRRFPEEYKTIKPSCFLDTLVENLEKDADADRNDQKV